MQSQSNKPSSINTKPVKIELTGDAGKRVIMASAKRILKNHAKEIKALADK